MSNSLEDDFQVHFIVGFSRSGTTWLCKSLNRHSNICAFGETSFWGRNYLGDHDYHTKDLDRLIRVFEYADLNNGITNKKSKEINNILENEILRAKITAPISPGDLFNNICNSLSKLYDKNIVIEKTPHHLNHINRIRKNYPNSKIIALERSLTGFYLSYKNLFLIQNEVEAKKLKSVFHPLGVLLIYKKYRKNFLDLDNYKNVLKISYEEILNDSNGIIKLVLKFLNINIEDVGESRVNSSKSSKLFKGLSLEDRIWIFLNGYKINVMDKPFDLIKAPLVFVFSLFKLPLWAFYVIYQLSIGSGSNPIYYILSLLKRKNK